MPPRSSSRHARNPATQLHLEWSGEGEQLQPGEVEQKRGEKYKNKYINLIQQESKNLFYFSPLLHVYSELHHSHGPLESIPNTGAAKRAGSRQDIFDLCIFLQKKHFFQKLVWAGRRAGWMAERSKALVSGTSLFGGVGSNPIPISTILVWDLFATRDVTILAKKRGCSRRGSNSRP